MFKLQLSLFYVSLLIALTFILVKLESNEQKNIISFARVESKNKPKLYRKYLDERFYTLNKQAEEVAGSAIKAYLYTMKKYKKQLYEIEREIFNPNMLKQFRKNNVELINNALKKNKIATSDIDAIDEITRKLMIKTHADFIKELTNTLRDEITLINPKTFTKPGSLSDFEELTKNTLINCLSNYANTCLYKWTYFPLVNEVVPNIKNYFKNNSNPDFILILDDTLVGRANSKDSKWSNIKNFADKYPIAFGIKQSGNRSKRDIIYFDDLDQYYMVVGTPVNYGSEFVGAVIVGRAIDNEMLKKDKGLMKSDLIFIQGDKIIASTVKENSVLLNEIKSKSQYYLRDRIQLLPSDDMIAFSLPLKGNYMNNEAKAILVRSNADILSGFSGNRGFIIIIALIFLLVGLIIIQILIQKAQKPFEEIESGIHEIISGNKNYYFKFDYKDSLAKGLAEALNLMIAVLLNKPLPEEEEEEKFLHEYLKIIPVETGKFSRHLIEKELSKELFSNSADIYYKNLYSEFISAKQSLGHPTDKITYIKFIEKVAKTEKLIKTKYPEKLVRLMVKIQDNDVILMPYFKGD